MALVFLAFAGNAAAWAQDNTVTPVALTPQAVRPVYLSSKSPSYDLALNTRIFEDASKEMKFNQIQPQFRAGQGKTPAEGQIYLGYTQSAYWVVFAVYNRNPSKIQWVLDFGTRMTGTVGTPDRIAIFTDQAPEQPIMFDGRHAAYKVHVKGQERNAVPLNFEPGQMRIIGIYVEPAPGVPLALNLQLKEPSVFTDAHDQYVLQDNVIRGGAALICLAFLAFWLNFRHAIPACLIAYLGMQYLIFTTSDEIIPKGNSTAAAYVDMLHAISAISALLLTRLVLFGTDRKISQRHILTAACAVIAALAASSMMLDVMEGVSNTLLIRVAPFVVPIIITTLGGLTVLRTERPQAIPFTFAWVLLTGGALLTEATVSGISSYTVTGVNFYWVCFVLHLSLLSFSSLRFLAISQAMHLHDMAEAKRRREEEIEMRKTKEIADQTRLLGVLQREKELMADLRSREQERIQAMRRAKEAADSANKAKSDFLAVISHEIRTPMTGVMGMIRLLLDTPLNDKQKEYAKTIQYSGDALLTLLNDILDLSKVEEGKMSIENIDFDLGKVAESVVLLMSGRAEERKIYLKAEIDPECPLMLKGDPTRLRQIFLNLISNAIKFTEKGGVTLVIKAHDKTAKKPRIYFGVKDTGAGISEDVQKKLFQPYQQADASTARKFGGTGLGLSICKRLVEAMGSSVQIASKLGEGTVFYFILSMEYGVGEAQQAQEAQAQASGVIPLKILVVDDNIINQRVVQGLLEKDGHKIVTVGGAEAALNEMKTVSFDIVLMDMEMPQIDGVMATQMIRRLPDPEKAKTIVIAMTGNVGQEDINRARAGGMDDYVTKPVNPEALRKLLMQFAKRKYPNQVANAARTGQNAAQGAPQSPAAARPAAPPAAPPPQMTPPPAAPPVQAAPPPPPAPPRRPIDTDFPPEPPLGAPSKPVRVMVEDFPPEPPLGAPSKPVRAMVEDFPPEPPIGSKPPPVSVTPDPGIAAAAQAPEPPAPPAPAAAPVDMAMFEQQKLFSIEVLGGLKSSLGKDQMDEMMEGLYQKTEELIGNAEKGVEMKDLKALVSAGHDIKGMTSNFGLTAMSDLGARLERQAKENFAIDVLADIVKKLRPTYYDTRSIVDKWMKI